jgi:adenosylhomocysteine nucleosidase
MSVKVGIIGAMHEEVASLLREMQVLEMEEQGGRVFYGGILYGVEVVLVFSRWGKVAAATTATQLIIDFEVDKILFTGIAGGLAVHLKIGDVVVGDRFYQHDMDASPMMDKYEIPLVGQKYFQSDKDDVLKARGAVERFLRSESLFFQNLKQLGIQYPNVYVGDMASGDLFVSSESKRNAILEGLPSVLCVDMESAAVAQVCYDFEIPLLVIRSISDTANHHAVVDFPIYLNEVASEYAHYILQDLLPLYAE